MGQLYVGRFPMTMGNDQLAALFQSFGRVLDSKVILHPDQQSKGYGFIHYETVAIAQVRFPLLLSQYRKKGAGVRDACRITHGRKREHFR
jgi:hypothetical protein